MFWIEYIKNETNKCAGGFNSYEEAEKFAENLGLKQTQDCVETKEGEFRIVKC